MELQEIVDRFAAGLAAVDAGPLASVRNGKTKEPYLPGVGSYGETLAVSGVRDWWWTTHSQDFAAITNPKGSKKIPIALGVKYEDISQATCDLELSTDGNAEPPEWWVEVKKISFVGDNGKNNDFGVAKALSPYLKDRSIIHDASRLYHSGLGRRLAVLVYAFEHTTATCLEAEQRHPQHAARIDEVRKVIVKNGNGLTLDILVDMVDPYLRLRGWAVGSAAQATFIAWKHPCAGEGRVVAWEIKSPISRKQTVDPRHPL